MVRGRDELVSSRDKITVDYGKAYRLIRWLEPQVMAYGPHIVFGVLRAGAIPALMLVQHTGCPCAFVQCNRADATAVLLDAPSIVGKRVLVVDDFAASGLTLAKVRAAVEKAGAGTVRTLALFYDVGIVAPPDFGNRADKFVHFLWDRLETTPSSRTLFDTQQGRYQPRDVQEFYGFDLELGDSCQAPGVQPLVPGTFVVLAPRVGDKSGVAHGLTEFGGVAAAPVHYYDVLQTDSLQAIVERKAHCIRRLGVSTYYSADLPQAMQLSCQCPIVDIVWWNNGRPIRLAAEALSVP